MDKIYFESMRGGNKENAPLSISYLSSFVWRRYRIAEILRAEHKTDGCVEQSRSRDCILYLCKNPRSGLAVVKHHNPEVVITDSRFDWETHWSYDGIQRVVEPLRKRGYPGVIFCLGMFATELHLARKAGVDGFMEEDEAFRISLEYSRFMVCEGIRSLLTKGSFFPVFPQPER